MTIYPIEQDEPSHEFKLAWQAAGDHLSRSGREVIQWLRWTLNPPLAEHLSFRLGNQLFFIFVETDEIPLEGRAKKLFLDVSQEATATPCRLPMAKRGAGYLPTAPGWGLVHAVSDQAVDPPSLVSAELVELSDWELHDFAVQIVRNHLLEKGFQVFGSQPSPHIHPALWFEDDEGPCWVIVRSGRYPLESAARPDNLESVRQGCARISQRGFFASVTAANADNQAEEDEILPLYRGHGMAVRFLGLEPI